MLTMVSTGSLSILNLNLMENILRSLCRHLVFMVMSFAFLYIVVVTFSAPINFNNWGIDGRIIFSCVAHVGAMFLHGYWLEHR